MSNPYDWFHQHILGHHTNTNIVDKDPDFFYKFNFKDYFKAILGFFFSYYVLSIFNPIIMFFTNFYPLSNIKFNKNIYNYDYILHKILTIFIYYIYPFYQYNFNNAIAYIVLSRILYSIFFTFNTQITHIHKECIIKDNDWYKHQILTSSNHSIDNKSFLSRITTIFSGRLNYQIEHHLFPNVNHDHLSNIQPIVEKICKKHNVKYKKFKNCFDAFKSFFNFIF